MADKDNRRALQLKKNTAASSPSASGSELVPVGELLPPNLFLLPVSQTTLFPSMIVPLILPEGKLVKTIEHVMAGAGYVGVILVKASPTGDVAMGPSTSMTGVPAMGTVPPDKKSPSELEEFHKYGVAAKVLKKINLPDNQVSVLLTGLQRFELTGLLTRQPHYVGSVRYIYEEQSRSTELEALMRTALAQFKQISKDNPLISEELKIAMVNIDGPGKLADLMASVLVRDVADYQHFLACADVKSRFVRLLDLLKKESDVQNVQRRIQDEINQKISSSQREFYLQEQLKFIQKELGRTVDERSRLIEKFEKRLKELKPAKEAKTRMQEELEKLASLPEQSSEYSVCINYLDWATALPWGVRSEEKYDLGAAKRQLELDHFGLKDVKDRILEFLAVRKLKKTTEGSILCFVGPPGTGKTSLGKSIARALNRKFFRFSVGGMRDEAEIKGHRRTYVGAMPGKMIQGMKRVGVQNPVFLIDEVDKLGNSFHSGGDPASALLELLDPEQNTEFLDHYLDIPFDCSEVFFITTANSLESIPSALLDRMEVIQLRGYTDEEKYQIARRYLIPKQMKKHGLKKGQLLLPESALRIITQQYAREAGVRNLEKYLARACRKVAYRIATGKAESVKLDTQHTIERYLGLPPFAPEAGFQKPLAGVATGLAWTQFGGDVLFIESTSLEGKGGISMTGSLGDVMKESANIAYTYVRKLTAEKMEKDYFEKHSLHLHVPAGATPKDGPSAGLTMAVSLYSQLTHQAPKEKVAMTGELSLTGRVLPVGGIKEKLLAARRSGITQVILPRLNQRDFREIEPSIRQGFKVKFVENADEAFKYLF